MVDIPDLLAYATVAWSDGGVATEGLKSFIRVPNVSPEYDPDFLTNGLIHQAVDCVKTWIEAQGIPGLTTTVFADPGREPLLYVAIPGTSSSAPPVLAYGHLDKMPPLDDAGWTPGLSARDAVIRDGKIYGRGANDDGYNAFLVISALKYLQSKSLPYPKVTMLFETGEESGGEEIERYLDELRPKIGDAGVILVLDGEAQDYKTVWGCTSLRGIVNGLLTVKHLAAPCHSGMATGLVPSTFRIARILLSRIEDAATGEILVKEAHVPEIPAHRIAQCKLIADQLGEGSHAIVSPLPGARLVADDNAQLLVNKAWKPGLAVTGCDGIPSIQDGSNVIRTTTALKLSLRIPPGVESEKVGAVLKAVLEADPPYGAQVTYQVLGVGNGWWGPNMTGRVDEGIRAATKAIFDSAPLYYGEGGSIPLCNKFQALWPEAQVLVSGCAGTDSNPHGYDESLNLTYTQKFCTFLALFLGKIAE
jgi:acetylornithine deacetylase/succinyl-diaminopimelate desuccinylase-like protein